MLIRMIHESKVETLKDPGVKLGRNCLGFSCPLRRGRSKVIAMKEALKTTYELEVLHEWSTIQLSPTLSNCKNPNRKLS